MSDTTLASATRPPEAGSADPPPRRAEPSGRAGAGAVEPREWVIDARAGSLGHALAEAWRSRELLWVLVERDLKVRYRQASLGVLWAVLSPLLFTLVLTVVFGVMARLGPEGVPYAPWLLAAMLVWTYFNGSVNRCSQTLLQSTGVLSRVYFPRLLLPAAALLSPLVDLGCGLVVLLVFQAWFGVWPNGQVVLLPAYLLLGVLATFGTGSLLGALNAYYRDVRHALPILLRLWFFLTPILYSVERVPEAYRAWYALNPMVSVVDGFRAGLLGTPAPTAGMVAASVGSAVVLAVVGVNVFHRLEKTVTDVL